MKKAYPKKRRMYAEGGQTGEPEPSYRDPYYEANAKLAYYKDILNAKLKAKDAKAFKDYFAGMKSTMSEPDPFKARQNYIKNTKYEAYLTPEEVVGTLGEEGHSDYINALKAVNTYNVQQGMQPLYGDIEGEAAPELLNYGKRFASLQVTPSISSTVTGAGGDRTYKRSYTYNPKTKQVDFIEEGDVTARPSYIRPKSAMGGKVKPKRAQQLQEQYAFLKEYAIGGQAMQGIANAAPQLLDAIIGLAEGTPDYSEQPIVNASTVKNMASPYDQFATGGIHIKKKNRGKFTASAKRAGMGVQEFARHVLANKSKYSSTLVKRANFARNAAKWKHAMGGEVEEEMEMEVPQFATGGKWIQKAVNPKHKGYCTPMTKSTCTPRRKALAMTFKKHHGFHKKHAYGGDSGEPIEVEGGEMMQYPNGYVEQVSGPKHENGGVDVNVPEGTKIYSDRLKIDGETMKDRKKARETRLTKLNKLMTENPTDRLLKNTYDRNKFQLELEESQDMQLQNSMNTIYNETGMDVEDLQDMQEEPQEPIQEFRYGGKPCFNCGGMVRKYPGGTGSSGVRRAAPYVDPLYRANDLGYGDPWTESINNLLGSAGYYDDLSTTPIPYREGVQPVNTSLAIAGLQRPTLNIPSPAAKFTTPIPTGTTPTVALKSWTAPPPPENYQLTAGDYIGMAGNAFNAIAPIINTRNAARATKPVMNRFRGFGQKALDTNQSALDALQTAKSEALKDIDIAAGSTRLSNRSGARSINTQRALDIATAAGADKARAAARIGFVDSVGKLLSERSQLQNMQDLREMEGQTKADEANAMNLDNYYSQMANNLTNLGTNVQGIGSALNKGKYNKEQLRLLNKLSAYGYRVDL